MLPKKVFVVLGRGVRNVARHEHDESGNHIFRVVCAQPAFLGDCLIDDRGRQPRWFDLIVCMLCAHDCVEQTKSGGVRGQGSERVLRLKRVCNCRKLEHARCPLACHDRQ